MKPDNGERKEEESMKIIRMLRGPFLDPEQDAKWYPQKDYHDVYVAEIVDAYVRK